MSVQYWRDALKQLVGRRPGIRTGCIIRSSELSSYESKDLCSTVTHRSEKTWRYRLGRAALKITRMYDTTQGGLRCRRSERDEYGRSRHIVPDLRLYEPSELGSSIFLQVTNIVVFSIWHNSITAPG